MIIHSKIPFHSIKARLQSQVCSISCCRLHNGCQLHYHAADCVLTSGYPFISQHIWIKIFITLAISGICISIEKLSTWMRSVYIHISRWIQGWVWCRLSGSVWWRCTRAFASPAWPRILRSGILATKAAFHLIFPKHSQESFHRSLPIVMARMLNSPLLLFSDFGPRCIDPVLRFLYSRPRNPSFGHLAQFNARHMSDRSSCTRPRCLVLVADIINTYKKSVCASKYRIRLLPLPYTPP